LTRVARRTGAQQAVRLTRLIAGLLGCSLRWSAEDFSTTAA
jgi:hypothetical protein